jgi:hypothetical protein
LFDRLGERELERLVLDLLARVRVGELKMDPVCFGYTIGVV